MEPSKCSLSPSASKKITDKSKTCSKYNAVDLKKSKDETNKETSASKRRLNKMSLIPKPKINNETKGAPEKQRRKSVSSKLSISSSKIENQEYDVKLKLLEAKEKSIAEYYTKIEELIRKSIEENEKKSTLETKTRTTAKKSPSSSKNSAARKMTSDPLVFNKTKEKDEVLVNFEKNMQQISDIWLQTSSDLTKTLKILKNNPSLDPMEFEVNTEKIQLALKQAKSLTLLKTRSVIAEAKKLLLQREKIRTDVETLLNTGKLEIDENDLVSPDKSISSKRLSSDGINTTVAQSVANEKPKLGGTGDSVKHSNAMKTSLTETVEEFSSAEKVEKSSLTEKVEKSSLMQKAEEPSLTEYDTKETEKDEKKIEYNIEEVKEVNEDNDTSEMKKTEFEWKDSPKPASDGDSESLTRELSKKNETITYLNKKIFELQKSCNEYSLKYNQLQIKLNEYQEKIQWHQALWKQMGKLKDRIKELQESNKSLESYKTELESKIRKLDEELERLNNLNQLLIQKKYLLTSQEKIVDLYSSGNESIEEIRKSGDKPITCRSSESSCNFAEKIVEEKQNVINQLKAILKIMKDQENVAQKQIAVFESKIEELKKSQNTR